MKLEVRQEFERVYAEYADAIFRYVYYRLQSRERALELTQEVFTRYWSYLAEGKTVVHPKAFLYRSAANAFINEIRTDKRTLSLEHLMESGLDIPYVKEDMHTLLAQQEAINRLASTEHPYRDVLVLRYVEDLRVKDIAELLGESENTISVRIKRGLEKLRKIYESTGKSLS
jgi:RNA polymerase sigma-70 factor (ECF subfamily)